MAKRKPLSSMAKPARSTLASEDERVDVVERAVEAHTKPSTLQQPQDIPQQRSRAGMKKVTVHMPPEAHKALKVLAMQKDEGLEEFILSALNTRLEGEGADFRVD
ncbi:ribbon-helix-helix domain-containing protein [Henriciella sp.]|uniref:ribbon-helix-helix domain-containing protein n=1 Tax=Henriciella sp. TaxID=1968823 RepID=UPI0026200772|nr:ribbon-helix-helix domain-containing protein [Henriciella sp.]